MEYFSFIHYKPKHSKQLGKRKKQADRKSFCRWRVQQFQATIASKNLLKSPAIQNISVTLLRCL